MFAMIYSMNKSHVGQTDHDLDQIDHDLGKINHDLGNIDHDLDEIDRDLLIDEIDRDLDHEILACRYETLCSICIVQIQPIKTCPR